jgi:hypothetical protein
VLKTLAYEIISMLKNTPFLSYEEAINLQQFGSKTEYFCNYLAIYAPQGSK